MLQHSSTWSIRFYRVWLFLMISAPFTFTIFSLNTQLLNILLLWFELWFVFFFPFSSLTNSFTHQLICQFLREHTLLFLIRWNPPITWSQNTAYLSGLWFLSGMYAYICLYDYSINTYHPIRLWLRLCPFFSQHVIAAPSLYLVQRRHSINICWINNKVKWMRTLVHNDRRLDADVFNCLKSRTGNCLWRGKYYFKLPLVDLGFKWFCFPLSHPFHRKQDR